MKRPSDQFKRKKNFFNSNIIVSFQFLTTVFNEFVYTWYKYVYDILSNLCFNSFSYMCNFACFILSADFFETNFFEKFFQEYNQRVKQFGFRSDLPVYKGYQH